MEVDKFEDLVHDAFIAPLRSVLIVDDQYPTWEEIVNSKIPDADMSAHIAARSANKEWHKSDTAGDLKKLISKFRSQKPGFIIDIHDGISINTEAKTAGNETPQQLADHLHQSDLLILDYNLEGGAVGTGGELARRILSSVLSNQYFNLVVVHTSEKLDKTIYECLLALMQSFSSQYDDNCMTQMNELDEIITEKEIEEKFDRNEIYEKLDMRTYIEARNPSVDSSPNLKIALSKFMQGKEGFADLGAWADKLDLERKYKPIFFYWALRLFEKKYIQDFAKHSFEGLWWRNSEKNKWLRTSRGFVCFVTKGPDDLLEELKNALVDWKPTPTRLLSAKYRYEISRKGAEVEDTSLSKRHVFAQFYETIVKPGQEGLPKEQVGLLRRYKLKDHVSRQCEMLAFLVGDSIADYGQKIYAIDEKTGFTFHEHYNVCLDNKIEKQKAVSQYNHYICCLPSLNSVPDEGITEQLDCGHIFEYCGTWWVCATPACDLQPGQNMIAFMKDANTDLRSFTAIKLQKTNPVELNDRHINSGSYCYVEYQDEIIALGLKPPGDDSKQPASQKVDWRTFVAKDHGLIKNSKLSLLELTLGVGVVVSADRTASVVAKLRYEYALNYIHRIGASVSRIGLQYIADPSLNVEPNHKVSQTSK